MNGKISILLFLLVNQFYQKSENTLEIKKNIIDINLFQKNMIRLWKNMDLVISWAKAHRFFYNAYPNAKALGKWVDII